MNGSLMGWTFQLFNDALDDLSKNSPLPTGLPDLVSDAMETLGASATNRYDMLKRMRLPLAIESLALEWRDHPLSMFHRTLLANAKLATWLFWTFCISTLVVAPLLGLFGTGVLSPVTYPVVSFGCGLAAYRRFLTTGSLMLAARRFLVPQAAMILLEWGYSPGVNRWWSFAPVLLALTAAGWLADRVNTHYVRWITANLRLKEEAAQRRRAIWDLRFDWFGLTQEISVLRREIRSLEANGRRDEAFILRRRAGELLEIRQYPLGFLALFYLGILLWAGAPSTVLVLSGFGIAMVLALRRPLLNMKLGRLVWNINIHSFVSWFSWDPKQAWVNSPGMFHDRLYSPYQRITQTVACFVLMEIGFVPPIHLWGVGEFLTPPWLWTTGYHFFLNLLLPAFLVLCTLISTGARPLWMHLEAIEWAEASEELEKIEHYFDAIVGRLQPSKSGKKHRYIWLGTHAEYGYPVIMPDEAFSLHAFIQGGTGSGKTWRILMPLLAQFIRGGEGAIIYFDLKGERAVCESLRRECLRIGRVFKYFTNELGLSTFVFNPFRQLNSLTTSFAKCVETIMEALRLQHGDGYGPRYFSALGRQWLMRTIKNWPNLSSFQELHEKASREYFKSEAEMDRCRETITVIEQVAEVTAMNWKPAPGASDQPLKDAIFMPDVVEQGQVVYFSLAAVGETSTVRESANLGLSTVVTTVKDYRARGGKLPVTVVIDEFQQMASENIKLVLRQARDLNIRVICACQSESDLMTKETGRLLDVVRTNTQTKIYLSVEDPNTIKLLEKGAGLIAYEGIDGKLDYRPRLTVNDIRHYSGHPDLAICWITRDSGFAAYGGDWFGLRTDYHITQDEYEERKLAPWPAPTESTIVAEKTPEGRRNFVQEAAFPSAVADEPGQGVLFRVVEDSRWGKRLLETFQRRFPERRNGNEGA
jgi:hypothetical protein